MSIKKEETTMSSPIDLISRVLCQSVDNIFAYKSFNQNDVFYSNIKDNIINQNKLFIELDIRSGAGLIPSAFIPNSLSTIITPSYSLFQFFNTIKNSITTNQRFHFNVPALNYTDDGKIVNDYSTALSFANSLDYIVLTPINSKEVAQTTLLSLCLYKYAKKSQNGVLHLFDSINYTQTTLTNDFLYTDPHCTDFIQIDHFLSKFLLPNQSSIDQVINKFNDFTGNHLHNFHYSSNSNEEIIFVTFGSIESELFNNSFKFFNNNNNNSRYGVLNIRIPIPFNKDQFITNIPSSTKKIIIINNDAFLTQQINATLFYHGKLGQITVSQFNYNTDFIWSQTAVNKIISSFTGVIPMETSNKNFIYWGNDDNDNNNNNTTSSSLKLLESLTLSLPNIVSQRNKFDNFTNGGIIQSQIFQKSNNENITTVVGDNIDLNEGQLAFVQDPSIIGKIDIVATLKRGSVLIINQPFQKDQDFSNIDTFLKDFKYPIKFINDLRNKNIKLYLIHGVEENIELLLNLIKSLDQNSQVDNTTTTTNNDDDHLILIDSLPDTNSATTNETNLCTVLPVFPIESAFTPSTIKSKVIDEIKPIAETVQDLARKLSFKEAYGIKQVLRPDLPVENYIIKVKSNRRVTPKDYDRYIFNIEFDITGTGLKYDIGESLGIHARNNEGQVDQFIKDFKLDPNELILVPNKDNNKILESRTLFQSLVENLDLFGKPPKRFYEALIPFVTDKDEREELEQLVSAEGALKLKQYQEVEYFTYVDILKLYKSAKWSSTDLVQLIPPLKRREYSIASSQRVHPNEIHLLIVVVEWVDNQGRKRFGQASKYISELQPGQELVVSIKPSVMKLPPRPEQPVIMCGLGTGLAPFKAIVEEKIWQMRQGMKIGKIFLFLGSRHKREEYLFGELWEACKDAGIITHIGAAFSRDQPQKIYIQDRIRECLGELKKAFIDEEGSFYLCGPTWPVPDITKALQDILAADAEEKNVKIDLNNAIEELKEASRYILEVY